MKMLSLLTLLASPAFAQELTVWDWKSGDPAAASYIEAAKEAFEAAHPGVTVNFVMQPNDQYYTLLGTALSSGAGPDVFLMNGGAQAKARFDALTDLSAEAQGLAGVADFADGAVVHALPITIQGFVVYFNKTLYTAAGLDPEKPPQTWEELKSACAALAANGPCFAMGNKEGFAAEFFVSALAASMLTAEEQAAFAKGELAWSSPKMTAILRAFVDTKDWGWYAEGANSTAKFMDEYEMFMRGEGAHTIGLLSDVAHWKQFGEIMGPETLGAFRHPAPEGAPAMPLAGGIGYGVNKASAHVDLATDLVKTLAAAGPIATFAQDAGILPANPAVDTSGLSSPALTSILQWTLEAAPMAHANATAAELEVLHQQSQLLLNGETTVADAAKALDDAQAKAR